jgi:hypothetical protein
MRRRPGEAPSQHDAAVLAELASIAGDDSVDGTEAVHGSGMQAVALSSVMPGGAMPAGNARPPAPALSHLARLLGRQAARQSFRQRSRGLGHIWVAVLLLLISVLLAAGLILFHQLPGR